MDGRGFWEYCVFHANWTAIPRQSGRWFHGKVDSRSDATRGGWNCLLPGGFLRQGWLMFSQGLAGQGERMGVVDQAVEDGIGQGGMAEGLVPVGHG